MSQKKILISVLTVLILLVTLQPGHTALAQEEFFLEVIYPQQGILGEVNHLLLRGAGFESIESLNGVVISGDEIPVLGFDVLSNEAAEVQILLPEDVPLGETEITFIFDGFGYDAFFIVVSGEERPFVNEFGPREGQIDTDLTLFLDVSNFALGAFGGVTLQGIDLPILKYEINESANVWIGTVYLPFELTADGAEIRLYFQNFSFVNEFFLFGPGNDQPLEPSVYSYDPNEWRADTEIDMVLQGYYLFEVGGLTRITIANIDVPFQSYEIESDESAVARVYLPADLPLGETRIIFYFESGLTYSDTFFVNPPDDPVQPALFSISPQDGQTDSEIELYLEGENLRLLGDLVDIRISGFPLSENEYNIESNDLVIVNAYIPEEAPTGDLSISIAFENADISDYFFVEPSGLPPWLVGVIGIVGGGILVGGGALVRRAIRKGNQPEEEPDRRSREDTPGLDFKVTVDFGTQTIETGEDSLISDLDIHFVISQDPGIQDIETEGSDLIDEQ